MTMWKDENGNTCYGVKQVKAPEKPKPTPKKSDK